MRTLIIWSAFIVIASLASCSHENKIEYPATLTAEVKSSFQDQFPNAKEIEWSQSNDIYEAEFVDNGHKMRVIYNSDGEVQKRKTKSTYNSNNHSPLISLQI